MSSMRMMMKFSFFAGAERASAAAPMAARKFRLVQFAIAWLPAKENHNIAYNTGVSEILRRSFLKAAASGALCGRALAADDPWAQVKTILDRIRAPQFPDRDFDITRFGARPDGKIDCTDAFRKAIEACNKAGGGRVVVPAGEYLTGAIHLRSNVN